MDIAEKVVAAIAGAIVGALLNWYLGRRKAQKEEEKSKREEEKSKRSSVIAYLEAVCVALDGMTSDFREGRIPHRSGRTFIGILDVFKDYTNAHLSSDTEQHIHKLRNLAEEAQDIDDDMYRDRVKQDEIERWIKNADRVIGDLQAEIAKLKGK